MLPGICAINHIQNEKVVGGEKAPLRVFSL